MFNVQHVTEVEEVRLIDGKKYSKLTIIDISHEAAFFDSKSGVSHTYVLRSVWKVSDKL